MDCSSCGSDRDCLNNTHCVHIPSFTSDTLRDITCQGTKGAFTELFGSYHLSLHQQSQQVLDLQLLSSSYDSLHTLSIQCTYRQCHLMSGADCSSFLSDFSNCIQCLEYSCSLNLFDSLHVYPTDNITFPITDNGVLFYEHPATLHPFTFLFSSPNSNLSSIFGCHDKGDCRWIHVQNSLVFCHLE